MKKLSVSDLLGIKYLNTEDFNLIFETASQFKEVINRPIKKVPSLRDITIANLFFENSTRTKLSFELAQKRLSADIINFSASSSSLNKGETLVDTANNILSMKVDMLIMRHPHSGAASFLANKTKTVIINAGDGTHEHPTQALLDTFSIREKLGSIKGKKVVLIGDIKHSRVALSNIFAKPRAAARRCRAARSSPSRRPCARATRTTRTACRPRSHSRSRSRRPRLRRRPRRRRSPWR